MLDGAAERDRQPVVLGVPLELRALDGAPAIVICSAGEVNAGDFDPVAPMAELAERYGAWLHVDGAFGLFAAVSPRTRHLLDGIERVVVGTPKP